MMEELIERARTVDNSNEVMNRLKKKMEWESLWKAGETVEIEKLSGGMPEGTPLSDFSARIIEREIGNRGSCKHLWVYDTSIPVEGVKVVKYCLYCQLPGDMVAKDKQDDFYARFFYGGVAP